MSRYFIVISSNRREQNMGIKVSSGYQKMRYRYKIQNSAASKFHGSLITKAKQLHLSLHSVYYSYLNVNFALFCHLSHTLSLDNFFQN